MRLNFTNSKIHLHGKCHRYKTEMNSEQYLWQHVGKRMAGEAFQTLCSGIFPSHYPGLLTPVWTEKLGDSAPSPSSAGLQGGLSACRMEAPFQTMVAEVFSRWASLASSNLLALYESSSEIRKSECQKHTTYSSGLLQPNSNWIGLQLKQHTLTHLHNTHGRKKIHWSLKNSEYPFTV